MNKIESTKYNNWIIVVWHPVSDIWKWWVTSSIASILKEPTVIKIDPMLELWFPEWLWKKVNWKIVTDDAESYKSQWLKFLPEQNIMLWKIVSDSINWKESWDSNIDEIPKKTYSDIAEYLSNKLLKLIEKNNKNPFLIEIWWCPDDKESESIIPLAIRKLQNKIKARIWIVLVTKYDIAYWKEWFEAKTRWPVRAIEETMSKYWWLPMLHTFIRRDTLPENIKDEDLKNLTKKVNHKTWIWEEKISYLPNVSNIWELKKYTENLKLN